MERRALLRDSERNSGRRARLHHSCPEGPPATRGRDGQTREQKLIQSWSARSAESFTTPRTPHPSRPHPAPRGPGTAETVGPIMSFARPKGPVCGSLADSARQAEPGREGAESLHCNRSAARAHRKGCSRDPPRSWTRAFGRGAARSRGNEGSPMGPWAARRCRRCRVARRCGPGAVQHDHGQRR